MPVTASYTDRHIEVAQEITDILADRLWPAIHVAQVFSPEWEFKSQLPGRWVWTILGQEIDVARLARSRMLTEYPVMIVTTRRYEDPRSDDPDGPVPTSWVRDECGWVHENVYSYFNDRVKLKDRLLGSLWPERCVLTEKYNADQLQLKLFQSVVEVAYREGREG